MSGRPQALTIVKRSAAGAERLPEAVAVTVSV